MQLIATNSNGCKDTLTSVVTVNARSTAGFVVIGNTGCTNNLTLTFNNVSSGAVSYVWSFGDGNTSTSIAPTHTYSTLGTYTIKLVTTNISGCKDLHKAYCQAEQSSRLVGYHTQILLFGRTANRVTPLGRER